MKIGGLLAQLLISEYTQEQVEQVIAWLQREQKGKYGWLQADGSIVVKPAERLAFMRALLRSMGNALRHGFPPPENPA